MAEHPTDDILQELISHPIESEDREYKNYHDLKLPKSQAELAKDIAAICNYGGGCVVFGFDKNMQPSDSVFDVRLDYNQDVFASIVEKYLDPKISISMYFVKNPHSGVEHPVLRIPPHGSTPVFGRKNGPVEKKRYDRYSSRGRLYS